MFFSRDTRYVKFIAAEYCSSTVGLVLVCLILRENIYDIYWSLLKMCDEFIPRILLENMC